MSFGCFDAINMRVYDFTNNGKCSNCGACCSNLLPMSDSEKSAIHAYIKKHNIKEQRHAYPTSDITINLVCPFRSDAERKCLIYPVRPLICRNFQCNKTPEQVIDKRFMLKDYRAVDVRSEFFKKK